MPCVLLGRYVRLQWAIIESWLEEWRQPGRAIRLCNHDAAKAAKGGPR